MLLNKSVCHCIVTQAVTAMDRRSHTTLVPTAHSASIPPERPHSEGVVEQRRLVSLLQLHLNHTSSHHALQPLKERSRQPTP